MLVSAEEMLDKARDGHYTVGQFSINNLEWTKVVLTTVQELNPPVILGISEGTGKYMTDYKTVIGMVNGVMEELNVIVPVALHLDHGSYDGCIKRAEAGLSSVVFDGSHYPVVEDTEKIMALVKICKEKELSIGAKVGFIGGEEDGVVDAGECTDPDECKAVADLGIDLLAVGIGNIHDKYSVNWKDLSFGTLEVVKGKVGDMPLVLHDGTGIPMDIVQKTISLDVIRISVNTERQLSFADATRKYIETGRNLEGKGPDPRRLLALDTKATKAAAKEKMELFGSAGKV